MKGQKNGEVLGTLTLPYTVPNPLGIFTDLCSYASEIVTKDDPRYPFATIHANPPGIFTDYPAVLKTQYGKGTVIWSCVPFEKGRALPAQRYFLRTDPFLAFGRTCIFFLHRS